MSRTRDVHSVSCCLLLVLQVLLAVSGSSHLLTSSRNPLPHSRLQRNVPDGNRSLQTTKVPEKRFDLEGQVDKAQLGSSAPDGTGSSESLPGVYQPSTSMAPGAPLTTHNSSSYENDTVADVTEYRQHNFTRNFTSEHKITPKFEEIKTTVTIDNQISRTENKTEIKTVKEKVTDSIHKKILKNYPKESNINKSMRASNISSSLLPGNVVDSHDLYEDVSTEMSNSIPRIPSLFNIPPAPPLTMVTETMGKNLPIKDKTTITIATPPLTNYTGKLTLSSTETSTNITQDDGHFTNYRKSLDISEHLGSVVGNSDKLGHTNVHQHTWDKTILEITLANIEDSVEVSWIFVSNCSHISGFEVSYKINDREDFDSSSLDISVRSFTLHNLHADEEYIICVHALVNNTIIKNSCADWSKSSNKVVIGILAGTIFLVPCLLLIVWILYKDHHIKKKQRWQSLLPQPKSASFQQQLLPHQKQIPHVQFPDDDGNYCTREANAQKSSSSDINGCASCHTHLQDKGHVNMIQPASDDIADEDNTHEHSRFGADQPSTSVPSHETNSPGSRASIFQKDNITYITISRDPINRLSSFSSHPSVNQLTPRESLSGSSSHSVSLTL